MTRKKTYLEPKYQCLRTLELAIDWCVKIQPFIRMLPTDYHPEFWETNKQIQEKIQSTHGLKYKNSFVHFLEHFYGDEQWVLGDWEFARARKNTRHLIKNDICLVMLSNGTERQPVWCASTKGKNLTGYYYETDRFGIPGDVEMLGVPDELIDKQLTHPGAQAFMLNLRAD